MGRTDTDTTKPSLGQVHKRVSMNKLSQATSTSRASATCLATKVGRKIMTRAASKNALAAIQHAHSQGSIGAAAAAGAATKHDSLTHLQQHYHGDDGSGAGGGGGLNQTWHASARPGSGPGNGGVGRSNAAAMLLASTKAARGRAGLGAGVEVSPHYQHGQLLLSKAGTGPKQASLMDIGYNNDTDDDEQNFKPPPARRSLSPKRDGNEANTARMLMLRNYGAQVAAAASAPQPDLSEDTPDHEDPTAAHSGQRNATWGYAGLSGAQNTARSLLGIPPSKRAPSFNMGRPMAQKRNPEDYNEDDDDSSSEDLEEEEYDGFEGFSAASSRNNRYGGNAAGLLSKSTNNYSVSGLSNLATMKLKSSTNMAGMANSANAFSRQPPAAFSNDNNNTRDSARSKINNLANLARIPLRKQDNQRSMREIQVDFVIGADDEEMETGMFAGPGMHAISKEATVMIPVGPNNTPIQARLKGAYETWAKIEREYYLPTACQACFAELCCIRNVGWVMCPVCRSVSSTEEAAKKANLPADDPRDPMSAGVGLTLEDLREWESKAPAKTAAAAMSTTRMGSSRNMMSSTTWA